jgi:hypothetical protein
MEREKAFNEKQTRNSAGSQNGAEEGGGMMRGSHTIIAARVLFGMIRTPSWIAATR